MNIFLILFFLFVIFYLTKSDEIKERDVVENIAIHINNEIKHRKGCGCRLCYTYQEDVKWKDFHKTSGQRVYATGTLPLFGLWTNKENLKTSDCSKASFDWRFNSPCKDPYSSIYPFPAECNDDGRCRIRGPLEDTIKYL